jgi:putative SOS response-associated peptidase YedK
MCCRFLLLEPHYRAILQRLGIGAASDFLSRYNIAPGSTIPAIRPARPAKAPSSRPAAALETAILRWGLVPSWVRDDSGGTLANARAESAAEKPSFRDAFRTRRCVVPASGFYEWEHRGRAKQPWWFRRRDEQPFGLAGVWETWRTPDGTFLESCAVLTTEPNELMRPIHHRMPLALPLEKFAAWLDPRATTAQLSSLLQPPPAADWTATPVSTYVSSIGHEGSACLAAAEADGQGAPQLSLGF